MVTRDDALRIAERFLDEHVRSSVPDAVVVDDEVALEQLGWVFPYQSQEYLDGTGSPLAGNLPIVVDQADATVRYMTLEEVRKPRYR